LRIISGKYKGRSYTGAIPTGIRPTTDNLRETIFNILSNYIEFGGAVVADICAGTGFMGFESISRGAGFCYFFEKSRKSIELINKIAKHFKIECYKILQGDAVKNLRKLHTELGGKQFDLIMFDPPYESNLFNSVIDEIHQNKLLSKEGILVVEMPVSLSLILDKKFKIITERAFGTTKLVMAKNLEDNTNS
jgi:16S rRNA (guanine(966)-N(2))-methyltransferase RsmD